MPVENRNEMANYRTFSTRFVCVCLSTVSTQKITISNALLSHKIRLKGLKCEFKRDFEHNMINVLGYRVMMLVSQLGGNRERNETLLNVDLSVTKLANN